MMVSNNEEWLEEISRANENEQEITSPGNNTTQSGQDESFYGFHGLDHANLYLYRVLSPSDIIKDRIVCKNPVSKRYVAQHIASGSRKKSKFISTTLDKKVAAHWAFYEMETPERQPRDIPLRIVQIDVQVLVGTPTEKKCINLCDDEVREHFIRGALHRNWAKSSKEVLFQYEIPKYVRESDKVSSNIQPSIFFPGPLHAVPRANAMFRGIPDDKKLVYYEAKDIQKPSPPPAKKPKKNKMVSLEESMANLNLSK